MSETPCPFCGQIHGTACNATTPANTTDHIAATTATRGDIASHEGDATIPAVVQDAQQYGHDEAMADIFHTREGTATSAYDRDLARDRLAAYIERLEAERDDRERWWHECQQIADRLTAERDALRDKLESGHWLSDDEWYAGERANADFLRQYNALLAEHEAWGAWVDAEHAASKIPSDEEWRELHRLEEAHQVAHDNAERVIHGE